MSRIAIVMKGWGVENEAKNTDGNISRITENTDKMILRATADGKPEYTT